MKKHSPSRRKLQLSRTTIRQLSSRSLRRVNGGTVVYQPTANTGGDMNQMNGTGGDSESVNNCLESFVACASGVC